MQNQEEAEPAGASWGRANARAYNNLKYAAAPLPYDPANFYVMKGFVNGRPLVLWASTHPGEEEIACRVHYAACWPRTTGCC